MSRDRGLPADLSSRFSALNPWPVRYTAAATKAAKALSDPADRAALEALAGQLQGFPPPGRQFQMRMDLSRGSLEVWALGGPHLRLRLTAVYRYLRQECAITHVELLRPKGDKP
jgi:hypothetical protein